MSTCCSLNCRLINYCSKYNNGVDRGEKCEVFEDIKYLVARTDEDRKNKEKERIRKLAETLEGRAETLQDVFFQLKMDDVKVYVKGLPGREPHICAKDGQKNFWKNAQIYDFVINECLGWNPDGSLQFGYGYETDAIRKMCKDAERYYGVKKDGVK